jgi:hypothetical protein
MPNIIPPYIPEGYQIGVVDFDVGAQRQAVVGKSVRLWWEQAVQCPCRAIRDLHGRATDTGEPQENCLACGGAGVIYTNAQQIVAMLTSTTESSELYSEFGPYAKGTTFITLLPENIGDTLDRYTLLDGVRVHGEIRRRTASVTEGMRYPIIQRTFVSGTAGSTGTPQSRTIGVQYCRAAGLDGTVAAAELLEGVDFAIDALGNIDWTLGDLLGTAPAAGATYTIRYYARPRFVLDDHVFLRRDLYGHDDNGALCLTPMPVRALALLDFLGGTSAGEAPPISPEAMR